MQAQQPAQSAHGQPEAQQHFQPGFTPAAGFKLPLSAPQECRGPDPSAIGDQTAWTTQLSCQPATADAAPLHTAGQQAVQVQKGTADGQLHVATTSDVLGQQANLWRQAASKRSALADLVPNTDKAAGKQRTRTATAGGLAQTQSHAVQQGCSAFKPAVQACIAAAGLPWAKPFYQQAVEHAMEHQTQNKAEVVQQQPSHPDDVKQEAVDAEAPDHNVHEVAGLADSTDHDATCPHHRAAQQSTPPQQRQPPHPSASPTPSSDSDLGTDLAEEEAKRNARNHISVESWDSALICGELQSQQFAGAVFAKILL